MIIWMISSLRRGFISSMSVPRAWARLAVAACVYTG